MADLSRVIIAHHLFHMRDAHCAAHELGTPLTLQTAAGALRFAGAAFLLSAYKQAHDLFPQVQSVLILDCGDAAAHAIQAMRIGHTHVRLASAPPTRTKLEDIARQLGVNVVEGEYSALDLAYAYPVADSCRKWLTDQG